MKTLIQAARRKGIKRKYLRLAALYRRAARGSTGMDFSFEALAALYEYESTGHGGVSRHNGWAYGKKKMLDVSVSDAVKGIREGDFCKAEFYDGPTGWYWRHILRSVSTGVFFPFSLGHRTNPVKEVRAN